MPSESSDKALLDALLSKVDSTLAESGDNETLAKLNDELEEFNQKRAKKRRKRRNLWSHWDVFLLLGLNIALLAYIFLFVNTYYYKSETTPQSRQIIKRIERLFYDAFDWLVGAWMRYNDFDDLAKEECALILPDYLNSIFRPIDNCQMCQNLQRIERLENMTQQLFIDKYAYTAVPVIIRNYLNEWPAMKVLNYKFLQDLYKNPAKIRKQFKRDQQPADEQQQPNSKSTKNSFMRTFKSIVRASKHATKDSKDTCQFFPYKSKFKSLDHVFSMREHDATFNSSWYVGWSNCNNFASSILRELYKRPDFLPDDSEMSKIDWIFMGMPGYGAQIHIGSL